MVVSPYLRPLGIAAAVLGTCQGIAWTILTILAILIRTEGWMPNVGDQYSFSSIVHEVFFFPAFLGLDEDLIMTGDVFLGFSAFYLPLSFIWTIMSLLLLWVLSVKSWQHAKKTVYPWCVITGIITIFDFILIILFSIDFDMVGHKDSLSGMTIFRAQVAIGAVMTIVARGYIILIAHAFFVVTFFMWTAQIDIEDYGQPKLTMPLNSRWHTTEIIPRVSLSTSNKDSNRLTDYDTFEAAPKRSLSLQMENGSNRPNLHDPHLANILRNQDENRRTSKQGPPPPPKPSALRPNSRYY